MRCVYPRKLSRYTLSSHNNWNIVHFRRLNCFPCYNELLAKLSLKILKIYILSQSSRSELLTNLCMRTWKETSLWELFKISTKALLLLILKSSHKEVSFQVLIQRLVRSSLRELWERIPEIPYRDKFPKLGTKAWYENLAMITWYDNLGMITY